MKFIQPFLLNCFILILPILAWNILTARFLPETYKDPRIWSRIPVWMKWMENVLRCIVLGLPLLLRLSFDHPIQRLGFILFCCGMIIYFISWILEIQLPRSAWSRSVFGISAPAYTTILWLTGIGLIGKTPTAPIFYTFQVYLLFSGLFTAVHTAHAVLAHRNSKSINAGGGKYDQPG